MGFDSSYHPVDVALIEEHILPYVRGHGDLGALVRDAVRIARVRFRANAWGLGALELRHERLDSMLHVWGRPFFITVDDPAAIGASIDRYLAARPDDVDAIAREMLDVIDPALADRVRPSSSGALPDDAGLAAGIRYQIELMRAAYANLASGAPVVTPRGNSHEPRGLLARDLALTVLELAAQVRPGWMDRGMWPTALLERAGVPAELRATWFVPPRALVAGVADALDWFLHDTIVENYMVGGLIPAAKVGVVRGVLARNLDNVEDGGRLSVRKMIEAMADAERRGLPFAEATEIYSGMGGTMN